MYSRLAPSLPREEHMHPLVDVLVVAASHGEHACPRAIAGCLLMLADLGRSRERATFTRRDATSATPRLHLGCTSAAPRLHLGCTSAAPRLQLSRLLHLGCISAASRLHLALHPVDVDALVAQQRSDPRVSPLHVELACSLG